MQHFLKAKAQNCGFLFPQPYYCDFQRNSIEWIAYKAKF